MNICRLCLNNEADKTGSHMIPHFLMKMIDTVEGTAGRDKELGFKLGTNEVGHYFGRSVQPEKLQEVFGEVTDEEIANSRSEVIIDHVFCSKCEDRLGKLENNYAKTLGTSDNQKYMSTKDSLSTLMFWASILWRASVSGTLGIQLASKDETKLREVLNTYMDLKVPAEELKDIAVLDEIGYKIIRSPGFSEERKGFMFFNPHHRRPYCFLIGELAVFFYMKSSHLKDIGESFFGLEKYLKDAETNTYLRGESILPLPHDSFHNVNIQVAEFFANAWTKGVVFKLNGLYKLAGGRGRMPLPLTKEILNSIASNERELGRKYTNEEVATVVTEIMSKYAQS